MRCACCLATLLGEPESSRPPSSQWIVYLATRNKSVGRPPNSIARTDKDSSMTHSHRASAAKYAQAFAAIARQGLPDKHAAMLREHAAASESIISWPELASKVGYRNAEAVKLQYGLLAHRIANELGIFEPPEGYWLNVLAYPVAQTDSAGHMRFALRPQVRKGAIEAGLLEPKA